jgi:O-antigen/teichoic acid export membrane protein
MLESPRAWREATRRGTAAHRPESEDDVATMVQRWQRSLGSLTQSRFARNWSLLMVSNLGGQVLGMLAMIRIARVLAPEGYGQYNVVQTTASIAAVLTGLGLRNVIIREVARRPGESASILYTSVALRALALAIVGVGLLIRSAATSQALPIAFAAVAVGLLAGLTIWELAETIVFGHERMELAARVNLAGTGVWTAFAWLVPAVWLTPLSACAAFALIHGVKGVVFALTAGRLARQEGAAPVISRALGRELLREGLPFYWTALVVASTNQLPILLLAARAGTGEVGLYNVSFRLIYPIDLLIGTALTALYPGLSRAAFGDSAWFMSAVRRALIGIALLATALALAVSLLRREAVLVLFGPEYQRAADAMALQCWYTVLYSIHSVIGTVFAARDRQGWMAKLAFPTTAITLPIVWIGTGYGATGLAAAVGLAALLNLTYLWVFFQRSLPERLDRPLAALLIAILLGGLTLAWGIPQGWSFPVRLALTVALPGVFVGVLAWEWLRRRDAAPRQN